MSPDLKRIAPLVLNPASLQFLGTGQSGGTRASQENFSGPFTISSSTCGGIATVAPQGASGEFSVLTLGNGTCSVTIAGADGQRATLSISVQTRPVPTPMPGPAPKPRLYS
jgi:hypothetical protein